MNGKMNWPRAQRDGRPSLDQRHEHDVPDRADHWLASAERQQQRPKASPPESKASATGKHRRGSKLVGQDGDPCPRCGRPTEVREHEEISEHELRKPFYYSRWFNCINPNCKTTLIMPPRFKVWNGNASAAALQPKPSVGA